MPWLQKCLGSIDFDKYQVIVVDNHSKDETTKVISEDYPQITLYEENQNLGFGQANNKGISEAIKQGADYVYLLNQDAYLESNTISKLIEVHQQYTEYGVMSPVHTNAEKSKLDKNFSNYISYKNNENFYSDFVLKNTLRDVYKVPFVNAAGWLISKDCLMKVGGFDPIFFHYGEDDNYCQRVKYHGFKIGVVPDALMVHDRENREAKQVIKYSEAYFKNIDKKNKVIYANINYDKISELERKIKNINKRVLKSIIKLNFEEAKHLQSLKNNFKKSLNQILRSRTLNVKSQANYLNLDN